MLKHLFVSCYFSNHDDNHSDQSEHTKSLNINTDNIKNEGSSNDYCVEQTEIVLSNVDHVRCKRFEHDLNQEENEEEQVNLY